MPFGMKTNEPKKNPPILLSREGFRDSEHETIQPRILETPAASYMTKEMRSTQNTQPDTTIMQSELSMN